MSATTRSQVTVQFEDVLDLVPKSTVKVNDVSVGQVKDIELDGYHAEVTLELRNDTELPDNAIAEIRQTSLLGEKFVSLSAPEAGASDQPLGDGDVIPLDRTGRNPEVEEVLGALSLILNGGGVAQLKTIAQELNKAVTGREDDVRSVLSQIDTFTGSLDTNKAQIVDAIEALNRLALSAHQQEGNIDEALEELPSALTSIDGQRAGPGQDAAGPRPAVGDVGVRVIKASKVATIDSLRQLQPVLNQLAASGDDFVNAFNVFLTYPFVDEVVGRDPQVARNLHMGDYTNLSIVLDVDLTSGAARPTRPTCCRPSSTRASCVQSVLDCIASGNLASAACQKVLNTPAALLKLKELCQQPANRNKTVCVALNTVPRPARPARAAGAARRGPPAPTRSAACSAALGLGRSGTGPWNDAAHGGPTMAQLQTVYDPSLVNLLVPTLVAPAADTPTRRREGRPSDHPPHQDPADGLRRDHAGRRDVRGRALRPARPGVLRRQLHGRSRTSPTPAASSPGGEVTYRGVSVGKVNKLVLTDDGVNVVLDIDNHYDEIPADTLAVVGNRSAVGEQYVELQPQRDDGPYLHDDSVIDEQDTQLPIATDTLLTHLSEHRRVGRQGRPEDHRRRARRRPSPAPARTCRRSSTAATRSSTPPTTTSTSPRR